MMAGKVSYQFINDMAELSRVFRTLDLFCEPLGISEKCRFTMHLSLEEYFSNIVKYGYPGGGRHLITITFEHEKDTVKIRVEDDGIAFNPLKSKPPDIKCRLEDRSAGGLGIYLTRQCLDEIKYQRKNNKNILTLIKQI